MRRVCSRCGQVIGLRGSHCGARRPSAGSRGYGGDWRGVRAAVLRAHPWCVFHLAEGSQVRATEVDHIIAKRDGGTDEPDNLRPLCKPCHSRRTALDQSGWGPGRGDHKRESRARKTAPSLFTRPGRFSGSVE